MSRVKHVLENVPELLDLVCGQVDEQYAEYVAKLRKELDDYDLVRKGVSP
jgi:hypothetical protein